MLLQILLLATLPQHSWPHLRGPALDGSIAADAFPAGEFSLRVAWHKDLGPSYSGVAIGEGLVITTYSDGKDDRVIALDAATGAERWQRVLEPAYLGHDGSEDGPIASPTIGPGIVWVISARAKLFALRLADGETLWTKDLPTELGTVVPEYGFASTPLLEGKLLIVQAGGSSGRNLCALDAATGALAWSRGDGTLEYTSPIAMELAGRRQLVVLAGKTLHGVAPESGETLWTHTLAGERDSVANGMASAMDADRFFANVSGSIAVFRVGRTDDGYAVTEELRIAELGRTYATPVYGAGHLWGFKSDFLTCVDAKTGKRLWKSRPPGGRGLIRVGERLVVSGAQGVVAVAAASLDDYHELARVAALDHTDYAWPSFADGRIYVRNSSALACVEVAGERASGAIAESASTRPAGAFGDFVRELEAASAPAPLVEAFLAEHRHFPLVEGNVVHFLFAGAAEDVAISGTMLDGSKPEPMARIGKSDLYVRSYPIEPGARWEYRLQVNFEPWMPDPRNPDTVPTAWGNPLSVVATPGRVQSDCFVASTDGPHGRLEAVAFTSVSLGNTRELQVWLPPGYDEGTEALPLLIVHQGPDWLEKGGLAHTLDNRAGRSFRAPIAVFVPPLEEWWFEGGGTGTEKYVDALATELVPFLAERYRVSTAPGAHALFGKESFGLTAILGTLRQPETFGKAGVLSFALGDRARHEVFERLEAESGQPLQFYVGWNRYAMRNKDRGFDYRAESALIAAALREAGHSVSGGEALDSCGWGSWRVRSEELLGALFPVE